MKLFKKKPRKLSLTQEGFEAQMETFLVEYGFEPTSDNKRIYASFIQHSNENEDTFDPELMAKRMRKALANGLAFYVIYPERKPKPVEATTGEASSGVADGQKQ